MSTTKESKEKINNTAETAVTETKTTNGIDWAKAAGYITTGVIILAMLILSWCGIIRIKNIDTACKYTQESVKLVSMNYFTLCKDKYTPAKVEQITNSVLASIKTTTDQLNAGKIDLADAKTAIIAEVDKAIDASKIDNPALVKQLAHIMINAGFSSIETYANDILKNSSDYVKLMNAISTGIQEGYNIVYPPVEAKTTAMLYSNQDYLIAA